MSFAVGVGLRPVHYPYLETNQPNGVEWFEAVSENYMDTFGRPLAMLERVRSRFPVALHGVGLSVASARRLDRAYLEKLRALVGRIEPFLVSDHFCWTRAPGSGNTHDLLPLSFTRAALEALVRNIDEAQNFLKRPLALENTSTYLRFAGDQLEEWEFIAEAARRSGCRILLDINNVFVNARNHGFDPRRYLDAIPAELVAQIHLAGHSDRGAFLFDTHSSEVPHEVWELYASYAGKFRDAPVLIEWDADIPPFPQLERQAQLAREAANAATSRSNEPDSTRAVKDDAKPRTRGNAGTSPEISLELMQQAFATAIVSTETTGARAPGVQFSELIPAGELSPAQALNVYQEAYVARLTEALQEIYPAVSRAMGEDRFFEASEDYIRKNTSASYNLSDYGRRFPRFLEEACYIPNSAFLSELARLELAFHDLFHAAQHESLAPETLSSLNGDSFEERALTIGSACFVFESNAPVFEFWKNTRGENALEPGDSIPKAHLLYKAGGQVYSKPLRPVELELFHALAAGTKVGESLERVASHHPEFSPGDAGVFFGFLYESGLISAL